MMVSSYYEELKERKSNGKKLDITDLTKEEWK